ncbi:hypothetical protein HYN43_025200 [Mucilaginibacter celer]|uniref:Uncharacterized protein n=1 Tax=Mucilaginibacter celer TaxID=2305508 RepID=A0A494VVH1_9SPHI|nr:hypothetical protein HYN43_025200 [Mucilaginibacter celer]
MTVDGFDYADFVDFFGITPIISEPGSGGIEGFPGCHLAFFLFPFVFYLFPFTFCLSPVTFSLSPFAFHLSPPFSVFKRVKKMVK